MKKILLISATMFLVVVYLAMRASSEKATPKMDFVEMSNVEALSQTEEDYGSVWFSNLRYVKCVLSKRTDSNGTVYKVYGNKRSCVREFTSNSCKIAWETACKKAQ